MLFRDYGLAFPRLRTCFSEITDYNIDKSVNAQKGVEVDLHLKEKRAAIMAAAGYDQVSVADLCKEINDALRGMGFSGNITAGADPKDT